MPEYRSYVITLLLPPSTSAGVSPKLDVVAAAGVKFEKGTIFRVGDWSASSSSGMQGISSFSIDSFFFWIESTSPAGAAFETGFERPAVSLFNTLPAPANPTRPIPLLIRTDPPLLPVAAADRIVDAAADEFGAEAEESGIEEEARALGVRSRFAEDFVSFIVDAAVLVADTGLPIAREDRLVSRDGRAEPVTGEEEWDEAGAEGVEDDSEAIAAAARDLGVPKVAAGDAAFAIAAASVTLGLTEGFFLGRAAPPIALFSLVLDFAGVSFEFVRLPSLAIVGAMTTGVSSDDGCVSVEIVGSKDWTVEGGAEGGEAESVTGSISMLALARVRESSLLLGWETTGEANEDAASVEAELRGGSRRAASSVEEG